MGAFVPPFTISIPVSTTIHMSLHPQVRAILDDRFIAMQNFIMPMTTREQPYGMPTSMIASFHNNASTFADHPIPFTPYNVNSPSGSSVFGQNAPPALTIESMIFLRQQMDESNHDMINMLTQQIDTIFNPLIQNTNQSYQALAIQMERIEGFFAPPQPGHQQIPQVQNPQPLQILGGNLLDCILSGALRHIKEGLKLQNSLSP
ncbi:hypothetical protein MTR_1g037660 [Medicago truncatula]|uniref:Uncharacterized protein n=1 Tax=Medicago truncatula TaxID=3880 RepID=A0A072VS49_MEDTR|nr:hypothetical protein MTR_1g037660 [Medicago truncatula]